MVPLVIFQKKFFTGVLHSVITGAALFVILCNLLLTGCATSGASAQKLQGAKNSYQSGDYETSFRQLVPLARAGDADAQYAVGYMYYYGYGVDRNASAAHYWLRQAAEKNQPLAIKSLELIDDVNTQPYRVKEHTEVPSRIVNPISDNAAILLPAVNYSLQLLGDYDLGLLKGAIEQHRLTDVSCWRTQHEGKDWYILTYGQYTTSKQAQTALIQLPLSLRAFKPWVRKVHGLESVPC